MEKARQLTSQENSPEWLEDAKKIAGRSQQWSRREQIEYFKKKAKEKYLAEHKDQLSLF